MRRRSDVTPSQYKYIFAHNEEAKRLRRAEARRRERQRLVQGLEAAQAAPAPAPDALPALDDAALDAWLGSSAPDVQLSAAEEEDLLAQILGAP